MKFLRFLKYVGITLIALLIVGSLYMNREGKLMYGGLTKQVDYNQFNPMTGSVAISNVNILSPDSKSFIAGQTVLIDNGIITVIDSKSLLSDDYIAIDGTDKYLIPGLIDAHVHLFQSPNDLLLYVANGVTEIRELIGEESHLEWKDQIENGRIGPQMFVASPRLGSFEPLEGMFMAHTQGFINVEDAADARKTIKDLAEKGYDGIKIYSQLNKESYLAIAETANSLGLPTFGHIPWSVDFEDIWQNGQSDIAHFEELMNALQREFCKNKTTEDNRPLRSYYGKEDEFLKYIDDRSESLSNNLIENNIAVTSTLWLTESFMRQKFELDQVLEEVELAYENPGISEWVSYIPGGLGWLPDVNRYAINSDISEEEKEGLKKYWETYGKSCQILARNLSKRGVKIMAGTDANLPLAVPGFSLHDELVSLNRAGMSTSQVLASATSIPADWLKSNSGKILSGYNANLVLLDKNPLEDISNTKTINTVITNGRVFDRELLDQMLASVKEANDISRKKDINRY